MKIALVHDYLTHLGGAERVVVAFRKRWPDADIHTLLYDRAGTRGIFKGTRLYASWLQYVPFARVFHRVFHGMMPLAVRSLDLLSYDFVLSSSSSFAKGVRAPEGVPHLCYCHSSLRYVWGGGVTLLARFRRFLIFRPLFPFIFLLLRYWDYNAAQRPTLFIANSLATQQRLQTYYRRSSVVIYPPVDVERFSDYEQHCSSGALIMLGRLLPYKRFDLGIRVAARLQKPLVIIGTGPEMRRLKCLARSLKAPVTFLGHCSDAQTAALLTCSEGLLFPGEEDFGIVPLEAMAAGCPVIAYGKGGACESVSHKKTGYLCSEQTVDSFFEGVCWLESTAVDKQCLKKHAATFSTDRFLDEIEHCVDRLASRHSF